MPAIDLRRNLTAFRPPCVVAAGVPPAVEGGILPPGPALEFSIVVVIPVFIPPGETPGSTAGRMPAPTKAFTLVEVLVALMLMAVVVPVAVQGLRLASLAGEVSQRKAIAVSIGERVLNEAIVTGQAQSAQSGTEKAGPYEFRWAIHNEAWTPPATAASLNSPNGVSQNAVNANTMQQVSVEVKYSAQGKDMSVRLSTLVNASQSVGANPPPPMNTTLP